MKKFTGFLMKRPIKIIVASLLIIVSLTIGITKVTLETGNDTLLSDKTDIYKDNESYQEEFGKEPIILLFTEKQDKLSTDTIILINQLQEELNGLEGIYSINSPVTLINEMSSVMYNEVKSGLKMISENLLMMGAQIEGNAPDVEIDFEELTIRLNNLIDSQNQLLGGLDGIYMLTDNIEGLVNALIADLTGVGTPEDMMKLNQIKVMIDNINNTQDIKQVPEMTKMMLTMMAGQFAQMSGLSEMMIELPQVAEGLKEIGNNLSTMANRFSAFSPTFPTDEDTISFMLDEAEEKFDGFIVGENSDKIRMVIVLDYDISDEQTDLIVSKLFDKTDELDQSDNVLISGKPVLDRAVKSSMMSSMVIMMGSAIIIMILILVIFYRVRMNLLPMLMMLLVVVATIGAMGWIGLGMTMVSMAVFPILIGLGIDYFVQFQTRYEEECVNNE